MENKFIEIFTGLKRDYGYADINSAYKDPSTGKLKLKYGWAAKELLESDYLESVLSLQWMDVWSKAAHDEPMIITELER